MFEELLDAYAAAFDSKYEHEARAAVVAYVRKLEADRDRLLEAAKALIETLPFHYGGKNYDERREIAKLREAIGGRRRDV